MLRFFVGLFIVGFLVAGAVFADDVNKNALVANCLNAAQGSPTSSSAIFAGTAFAANQIVQQGIYVVSGAGDVKFFGVSPPTRVFESPLGIVKLDSVKGKLSYSFLYEKSQIDKALKKQKRGLVRAEEIRDPFTGQPNDPFMKSVCTAYDSIVPGFLDGLKSSYRYVTMDTERATPREIAVRAHHVAQLENDAMKKMTIACNRIWEGTTCSEPKNIAACNQKIQEIYTQLYNEKLSAALSVSNSCLAVGKNLCHKSASSFQGLPLAVATVAQVDTARTMVSCQKNRFEKISGNIQIKFNVEQAVSPAEPLVPVRGTAKEFR